MKTRHQSIYRTPELLIADVGLNLNTAEWYDARSTRRYQDIDQEHGCAGRARQPFLSYPLSSALTSRHKTPGLRTRQRRPTTLCAASYIGGLRAVTLAVLRVMDKSASHQ